METIFQSFILVFISEMGDKTQLLALVLAARFKKPLPIMMGILVATVFNHGLASYIGNYLNHFIDPLWMKWILSATFVGFGLWMLIPDKDEGLNQNYKWGPFLTTTVAFFFAEMGDKTQLATVALSAKFMSVVLVTFGTTLGMLVADGLAVYFGHHLTEKISMKWIHRIASGAFILFGIALFFGY